MMTVRFPSGFSIQYNTASFVRRNVAHADLYTKENGQWIAQVPNEAVIEAIPACRTYFAQDTRTNLELAGLSKEVRSLKRKIKRTEPKP